MESLLNALEKDDVLANDIRFKNYVKTLPRQSSLWAWAAPSEVESTVKKHVKKLAKTDFGAFRQVDYIGVVEGDVFYITLSLQQPSESLALCMECSQTLVTKLRSRSRPVWFLQYAMLRII